MPRHSSKSLGPSWRAEIRSLVTLQFRRQRSPGPGPRRLDLILDESVLLRPVGSPQVMPDQLARLLAVTREPSITMHVIHLTTAQPVLSPSFTLPSLPGTADSVIAYVESIGAEGHVIKRAADVDTVQRAFDALVTSAFSPTRSAGLIEKYPSTCPKHPRPMSRIPGDSYGCKSRRSVGPISVPDPASLARQPTSAGSSSLASSLLACSGTDRRSLGCRTRNPAWTTRGDCRCAAKRNAGGRRVGHARSRN